MNRRTVVSGLGALSLCGSVQPAFAQVVADEYESFSVSDGHLVLPWSFLFEGLPAAELGSVLAPFDLGVDQIEPPCNVTLLRHPDRTVLFDAGAGSGFMPSAGALLNSLDALGVTPDEITHVVFTHGHPDHLWGVLDDFDDPVFADATFLMGALEWDYWRDPATLDTIGADRVAFAVGAARRLDAIEQRIELFNDGQEILPGIMARATFGHTPGHMAFEVRAGGEPLLIGGDAIGNHHVAFARPDWHTGADQDRAVAAATRVRLLDQLAHEKIRLMGFHLPGGGLGRVERKDGGFRFVAEGA